MTFLEIKHVSISSLLLTSLKPLKSRLKPMEDMMIQAVEKIYVLLLLRMTKKIYDAVINLLQI